MERKVYTFLIFPGAHGKLRKIQLPYYVVHLVVAFSIVGALTVVALANSYARMLLKVSDYNNLRTDREALKTQFRTLETVVTQANAKLDSLQSLAAEVALSYGLSRSRQVHVPGGWLDMALQSTSTPESGYRESMYAFNLMRDAASSGSTEPEALDMLSDPGVANATVPSIWPVHGSVTAGFGQRMDPFSGEGAFHAGLDISAPSGTSVVAAADGIVFYAGPDQGYGNEVLVDHGYGIKTKYGHLSKIYVVLGQEVRRGQKIGAVGTTGKSTGPHLHYEVLIHETPVNPTKYLRG